MRMAINTNRSAAFTLVELLVVIAIIGILVTILVPALAVARGKARDVAVKAQISSLSTALEVYRGESALGGEYPPSQTDNNISNGNDHRMLTNPLLNQDVPPDTVVAGTCDAGGGFAGAARLLRL